MWKINKIIKNKMTNEKKLIQKDQRAFAKDPLGKLNKAQTKRLEDAFFAQRDYEIETMGFVEDELTKAYNF